LNGRQRGAGWLRRCDDGRNDGDGGQCLIEFAGDGLGGLLLRDEGGVRCGGRQRFRGG
jgi:hypothetical protein